MNPGSDQAATFPCHACGAPLRSGEPCAACALAWVLATGPEPGPEPKPGPEAKPEPREAGGIGEVVQFLDSGGLPGRFGPYLLRREIAVGGMGAVYEAEDGRSRRKVALKLLRAVLLVSDADRARFQLEAEAAARLDHPNIVPVFEVGEERRQPYFTMKLMEGGTLAERLAEGPIPPRTAAAWVAKIARAVQHAHQRGVLHRDIKPGNVLFDAVGEPHLTDFGLAKLVHAESTLTVSSAQLGTPQYMSPEQAAGRVREIGMASDVWGLGAVLYHLLSGRVPFPGDGHAEIFRRIAGEEPVPPCRVLAGSESGSKLPDSGPGSASGSGSGTRGGPVTPRRSGARLSPSGRRDLDTICLRCLEKDPARRLASAGELADELDRWRRGEPIQSRAVTAWERAAKWARRNPELSWAGALLLASLVAGAVTTTILWRRAEVARARAEQNTVLAEAHARAARLAESRTSENAYYAILAQALATRQQGDLGHARRLLDGLPVEHRGFEWRLLQWLSRSDERIRTDLGAVEARCLAWEPRRGGLALLGEDRVLRWLDPAGGGLAAGAVVPDRFADHAAKAIERGIHDLTFSPDGRHFACGDGDVLVVAETATGKLVRSMAGRRMTGVWLDDRRLLFAGKMVWGANSEDAKGIFDLVSGLVEALPGDVFAPFALSPDRSRVAWCRDGATGHRIEVVPVAGLAEAARGRAGALPGWAAAESLALLAFATDGEAVGAALARQTGRPNFVAVYHPAQQEPVLWVDLDTEIRRLSFNPNAPDLAVATADRVVRCLRYSGPMPVSGDYDDDAFPDHAQPVPSSGPRMPPSNLLSRTAFGGQVRFFLGHESSVNDLWFAPPPLGLVTLGGDRTLRAWPREASVPSQRVSGVWSLNSWEHPATSVDGLHVLYRADTNRTWLWHRPTGRRFALGEWHYPLAVRRDGSAVTRHFQTGEITVWTPPGAEGFAPREAWSLRGILSHPGFGQVIRGCLAADDRTLVGLIPGKLLTVDLAARTTSGTGDQRMLYGPSGVNGIDLSPDGRTVAVTGLLGRRARLYRTTDLNGGYATVGDARDFDTTVAFHPDGRRLFVGNEDGWVRVFEPGMRAELAGERWRAHSGAVIALAVSGDGRIVATSGDRVMDFWDATPGSDGTRRLRLRVNMPSARNWMKFAREDQVFLHVAPGQALEAWEAP